jgi:hypothetical protein
MTDKNNWIGHYIYEDKKYDMNFNDLTIELVPGGKIAATGNDIIGDFTIYGVY